MFDENQIVQVRWNNSNKEWYESRGYVFTKRNASFDVYAKDLSLGSNARIKATCDYCGEEYETCFIVLINGRKIVSKDCCCNCTGKKTSDVSKQKRAEKYIGLATDICKENNYILLTTVNDYIDLHMDIEFVCHKHGYQTMIFDNFIRGHKCKDCSYEERAKNLRHDIKYVKERIENFNGNKLLNPEDYKDTFTRNLNILCSCGNIFTTSFKNYDEHGVNTCFSCSCKESSGEERIRIFLESNKIEFIQEKRFADCRDKRSLPFDFYLPQYNLLIEFDGQQHYEPKFGEDNFVRLQKHDKIKNEYCKIHNINLLRIPYWEGSNIESIISKQLNL